jgi:HSP20 family protein
MEVFDCSLGALPGDRIMTQSELTKQTGELATSEELGPWRPGPSMRRLFDDVTRLVDDTQRAAFGRTLVDTRRTWPGWLAAAPSAGSGPRIEVCDTGREVVVCAELPGVDLADVRLECTAEALTLRGTIRQERPYEARNVYQSERRYGSFLRQVPLPSDLDIDMARATFTNGLLTVRLPKRPAAQPRRIPIDTQPAGGPLVPGSGQPVAGGLQGA